MNEFNFQWQNIFTKSIPNNGAIEEIIMYHFRSKIIVTNMHICIYIYDILFIYLRIVLYYCSTTIVHRTNWQSCQAIPTQCNSLRSLRVNCTGCAFNLFASRWHQIEMQFIETNSCMQLLFNIIQDNNKEFTWKYTNVSVCVCSGNGNTIKWWMSFDKDI